MNIFEQLEHRRDWSEEERLILDSVRRLAAEIVAPAAGEADRTGAFPWENVEAINALGLNAMFVPEAYGGSPTRYTALSRGGEGAVRGLRLDRHHLGHQLPRPSSR